MTYRAIAEQVADDFRHNPADCVAEADIQSAVIEALREELSPTESVVTDPSLDGTADGYKRRYWQTIEERLAETGTLNRAHAEVSVRQGERLDVAVFRPKIEHPIEWVSGGSKRFSELDLECVYELKFVKNKTSFPTHSGQPVGDLADEMPDIDAMLEPEDPVLDFSENKIRADIEELNRLNGVDERYLLLFSNNNYLYHDPTPAETEAYRYGDLYQRMGEAARQWMRDTANEGTEILYVHPRGSTWITE